MDVNVHPTKMDIRFSNQQEVYRFVCDSVKTGLQEKELIPQLELPESELPESELPGTRRSQEKEILPAKPVRQEVPQEKDLDYFMEKMKERVTSYHRQHSAAEVKDLSKIHRPEVQMDRIKEASAYRRTEETKQQHADISKQPEVKQMDFLKTIS